MEYLGETPVLDSSGTAEQHTAVFVFGNYAQFRDGASLIFDFLENGTPRTNQWKKDVREFLPLKI